jgi:hypothetical protein
MLVKFVEEAVVPHAVERPRNVEKDGVGRALGVETTSHALNEA